MFHLQRHTYPQVSILFSCVFYNSNTVLMGANQLPQDGVCYPFTFIHHAPKFIKQMTGSGVGFICVVDICPMQVTVRHVGGMMLSCLHSPHVEKPSWLAVQREHSLRSVALHISCTRSKCRCRKLLSTVCLPSQTFRAEAKLV